MEISPKSNIYLDALIGRIVRHRSVSIDKLDGKAGRFRIGDGKRVFIKPNGKDDTRSWRFTFRSDEVRTLATDFQQAGLFGSYLLLGCALDSVCVLRSDEWQQLLSPRSACGMQSISVRQPVRCSMTVRGTSGPLPWKVPANRFPAALFSSTRIKA